MMPLTALDSIRSFVPSNRVLNWEAGELIFCSGDPGDSLYGVMDGSIALSWLDAPDQNLFSTTTPSEPPGIHEILHAGEVFGADALVSPGHIHINTAQAATACQLLVMKREEFLFAIHESPVFSWAMLQSLDERLRGK